MLRKAFDAVYSSRATKIEDRGKQSSERLAAAVCSRLYGSVFRFAVRRAFTCLRFHLCAAVSEFPRCGPHTSCDPLVSDSNPNFKFINVAVSREYPLSQPRAFFPALPAVQHARIKTAFQGESHRTRPRQKVVAPELLPCFCMM